MFGDSHSFFSENFQKYNFWRIKQNIIIEPTTVSAMNNFIEFNNKNGTYIYKTTTTNDGVFEDNSV